MTATVQYRQSSASPADIEAHLRRCDAEFNPPLSQRLDIAEYAAKLAAKAVNMEAWGGDELVGLVSAYCNDPQGVVAYVSNVSVQPDHARRGLAAALLTRLVDHARGLGLRRVDLEVHPRSLGAVHLYTRTGFTTTARDDHAVKMSLHLG